MNRFATFLPIWAAIFACCSITTAQVNFLQQNWSDTTRQSFYTTTQGSRMMPYSWFMALETADGEDSFVETRLPAWGYLPNPNQQDNPDQLPVGFVKDVNRILGNDPSVPEYKKVHIGLTCAACHTNRIVFDDKEYQIDGAPTLANMFGMLDEIDEALKATRSNASKLNRFVVKVLGSDAGDAQQVADLTAALDDFIEYWSQFVEDTRVEHAWGRGRLDAFGMIFNRVSSIDLNIPENSLKPTAPVSYPFVWGTSFQDKVQWNGSVPNTNDIERLGRNVGEVLGVFAQAQFRASDFLEIPLPARTSAKRLNLVKLENQLKTLWSPKWPGELDQAKLAEGKKLYDKHCIDCHVVIPHGQQNTPVDVTMTPISDVKTDPLMATNAAGFRVKTGHLRRLFNNKSKVPRAEMLQRLVRLAVISPNRDVTDGDLMERLQTDDFFSPDEVKVFLRELEFNRDAAMALVEKNEEKLEAYYKQLRKTIKRMKGGSPSDVANDSPQTLAYKAAPLAGIWATAPYLHNGSVPNLYELLSPVKERSEKFHVGSNVIDTERVGFQTDAVEGSTLFDTSLPGNRNVGHDMYGNFSKTQRWQLVEYLKSL